MLSTSNVKIVFTMLSMNFIVWSSRKCWCQLYIAAATTASSIDQQMTIQLVGLPRIKIVTSGFTKSYRAVAACANVVE
jgi:hypothetical protein